MHVFLFSVLCGISPKSVSFCFILSHFPKRRSTVPDACESAYGVGGGHALHEPVPACRPKKGDAKVRTGVRRRSGRVTGAGGEASKARNAGVCLRAGWRLRRPSAGAPSASGRESGPSGCDVAAYPTNRPAGPCRPRPVRPQSSVLDFHPIPPVPARRPRKVPGFIPCDKDREGIYLQPLS